jgi:hypothetical protein
MGIIITRVITFILVWTISNYCNGQESSWIFEGPMPLASKIQYVRADGQGNSYALGSYGDDRTIHGLIRIKLDSLGSVLKLDSSRSNNVAVIDLEIDSKNDLYALLNLRANVKFGETLVKLNRPGPQAALVKYNSDGLVLWYKTFPDVIASNIAIGKDDMVYLSGESYRPFELDGIIINDSAHCIVLKFIGDGTCVVAANVGSLPATNVLVVGNNNRIFIGLFENGEYSILVHDLNLKLQQKLHPSMICTVIPEENGNLFFIGEHYIEAITAEQERLWAFDINSTFYPSAITDSSGDLICLSSSREGALYYSDVRKLSALTGKIIWTYKSPSNFLAGGIAAYKGKLNLAGAKSNFGISHAVVWSLENK